MKISVQVAEAESNQKRVLLFANMRGGSTILGRAFEDNPNIFFWYEPLDAVYSSMYGMTYWKPTPLQLTFKNGSRRWIADWEKSLLAESVHNILTCNITKLPTELLTHPCIAHDRKGTALFTDSLPSQYRTSSKCKDVISKWCFPDVESSIHNNCPELIYQNNQLFLKTPWSNISSSLITKATNPHDNKTLSVDLKIQSAFRKHSECLSRFHSAIAPHLNILQKSCQSKPIVATKMLRLTMDTVQEVIERMPAVYVIYYVRDPRATIVSRKYPPSTKHKVAAAASLCDLMRWDYKEYERINELYPGVIKLLRYEDYIADVNCTLEAIYAHIHERPHAAVYEAMAKYMGGVKKPEKSQSQNRADPLKHLTDWADSCKQEEIVGMNKACADILDTFNYTFMTHIQYN